MNLTFVPSLKHINLVNIATTFWNQDDIRNEILHHFESYNIKDKWPGIERMIIEKVSQLSIPESLIKEIIGCIKPVGDLINNWIFNIDYLCNKHGELHGNDVHAILPNRFHWTPQGTIDQKKTAEELVKDERIRFSLRYRLACNFCLEADILTLRKKIPTFERMDFYSRNPVSVVKRDFDLVVIWNYDLTKNVGKRRRARRSWPSRYGKAFECAAIHGNKAATEYFFQKLTHEEREASLIKFAFDVTHAGPFLFRFPFFSDVFCFLLSQMSAELQMRVFEIVPETLACFLVWPWQNFFLKTAHRVKDCFIKDEPLFVILRLLIRKDTSYTDCNYKMLLGEFWKQIPNFLKTSILNEQMCILLLLEGLLWNGDRKNLELIFEDAMPVQKRKYSSDARFILEILKKINDEDLLKIFLERFVTSEGIATEFLEVLNQSEVKKSFEESEDVWDKLSELLNEIMRKLERRRSMNEVSDCPAKRLCGNVTH